MSHLSSSECDTGGGIDWASCTFEACAYRCANRLVRSVTAPTWPEGSLFLLSLCVCWGGELSGRGTGSA